MLSTLKPGRKACVKRLQQFLHRAVLRLKATRIMVKAGRQLPQEVHMKLLPQEVFMFSHLLPRGTNGPD